MSSKRLSISKVLLIIAVIIVIVVGFIALDVYRFSQKDQTRSADAAIVLGAAVFRERPSPVFRERINHAVQLYKNGTVEKIIFTGGVGRRDLLSEAEVGRNYALTQGIPEEAILIESSSTSTLENLTNARQLAKQNGLERFLIVSTPFHMRRALSVAADLEMEAYSSPTRTTHWLNWVTQSLAFTREVVAYIIYLVPG